MERGSGFRATGKKLDTWASRRPSKRKEKGNITPLFPVDRTPEKTGGRLPGMETRRWEYRTSARVCRGITWCGPGKILPYNSVSSASGPLANSYSWQWYQREFMVELAATA